MTEERFFKPVLATFVHALPNTFRDIVATGDTSITLIIAGKSGGEWTATRQGSDWALYEGRSADSAAQVRIDQTAAWRLFTKGLSQAEAEHDGDVEGDPILGRRALASVAIIA